MRLPAGCKRRFCWSLLTVIAIAGSRLGAQSVGRAPLPFVGGEFDERSRLGELVNASARDMVMLRATSRLLATAADTTPGLRVLLPEVRIGYNSALPHTINDGPLWAGRGVNALVSAGVAARRGRFALVVAPQLVYQRNEPYQVISYPVDRAPFRSPWANPFHPLPESVDLPLRFGDQPQLKLDAGQSSLTATVANLEVGIATENLWWGPGIRNAIVLSNNAAGFPHLLLRTPRPLTSRVGLFDFDLIAGRLTDSDFFGAEGIGEGRSIAGGAVNWRRAAQSGLRLGLTRLRIAGPSGHDQMSSLFARWVLPSAGFEGYVEWARFQDPRSLRDFLELPTHTQGYTYGLQWARPLQRGRVFRLQAEHTYLEPSPSFRIRSVPASYTSRSVPQGFTHRGQVLGASSGPGSSNQWLAGDIFSSSWRLGGFAGRTRVDNGTLFGPLVPEVRGQDVTLLGGIRGSGNVPGGHLSIELTDSVRLNYLFQAGIAIDPTVGGFQGVDIPNRTIAVTFSTAFRTH